MKLKKLLLKAGYQSIQNPEKNHTIRHICCDSRMAHENSVFVCIKGAVTDGHLYAGAAYMRGCRAFVAEKTIDVPVDASITIVDNSRRALAVLSDILYLHPSEKVKVIGITGTKGKTSTAMMIYEVLNKCGVPAGYIGTNGIHYAQTHQMAVNTTPESCDIQYHLYFMARQNIKYLILEVSSQALYLERIYGIEFDTCIFTNLTPDHIGANEHPTFEHYKSCKAELFSKYKLKHAIANADDPYMLDIMSDCSVEYDTFGTSYTAHHQAQNISLLNASNSFGVTFEYICDDLKFPVKLNCPGNFSVQNALAAIAVCRNIVTDTKKIISILNTYYVPGRFEVVPALPYATTIIDYAHNGTSLKAILETLRSYNPKRLICLFGSVGGRTQMRRAELGKIASSLCDFCIITADNPDREDPELINLEIARAFNDDSCDYICIADRKEAIFYAVKMLKPGDILLLAGKGHENFQYIRGEKIPFCEREILFEAAKNILELNAVN